MANFKRSEVCMISAVTCVLYWVWHLYNLSLVHYFGSFLLQDMFVSLQVFAFEGQNIAFTVNVLLTWFLPQATYLPSYVFLWRCHSITLRKLYASLEKFLCFSCTIWSSLCSGAQSMYRFIPPLIVLVPQDSKSVDCVECCRCHCQA